MSKTNVFFGKKSLNSLFIDFFAENFFLLRRYGTNFY